MWQISFITVSLTRGRGGPVEAAARVERVCWEWDSTFQSEIWHVEPDQTVTRWWTVSQAPADKGGKRRRLTQWSTNSWLAMSGPLLDPLNRLSFVPSVPWRDFRSLACPSPRSRGFNHKSSGFVPPPPLATLAPVFAHLPMWPIT